MNMDRGRLLCVALLPGLGKEPVLLKHIWMHQKGYQPSKAAREGPSPLNADGLALGGINTILTLL